MSIQDDLHRTWLEDCRAHLDALTVQVRAERDTEDAHNQMLASRKAYTDFVEKRVRDFDFRQFELGLCGVCGNALSPIGECDTCNEDLADGLVEMAAAPEVHFPAPRSAADQEMTS